MSDRTWEEGAIPTPAQLLEWLRATDDTTAQEALARLLSGAEAGSRCFKLNHDDYPLQVKMLQGRLRESLERIKALDHLDRVARAAEGRYRLAWLSARHRARGFWRNGYDAGVAATHARYRAAAEGARDAQR